MSETKIPKISTEVIAETAQRLGLLVMSAALAISVLESPDDTKRVVLPNQPAPVWANAGQNGPDNNPIRREREETAPHFISYSEIQRTPTRSGKG